VQKQEESAHLSNFSRKNCLILGLLKNNKIIIGDLNMAFNLILEIFLVLDYLITIILVS